MILKAVTCNVECILFSLHQYIKKTLGLTLQFKFYMYNSEKKQQIREKKNISTRDHIS